MYDGLASDAQQQVKYHLSAGADYRYLNEANGNAGSARRALNKANGRDKLTTIHTCFETIGFKSQEVNSIYSLLAGILHLGNLVFVQHEGVHNDGKCHIADESAGGSSLVIISQLLGIDDKELQYVLTQSRVVARGETMLRSNSMRESLAARDSMAKSLYGRLFSWIVNKINLLLQPIDDR